ncbi:MAG: UDP-N-acetylmuramate--alanine ligase [Candidatus Azobacteroides sp.]|nr:UDP-N-acetylmuramate--alanine ligase [Candidatus Azobacteroides sp.]
MSGSDPEIKEPYLSRLKEKGVHLYKGWDPDFITNNLMAVVPAPHIDNTNPELIASKEKRVLTVSLSEFIFERTKNKIRVVVAGSKNRKCFLSLLLKTLKEQNVKVDYALNSEIEGIDKSIALSYDARIAVIEGDEFFTATIDKKPLLHFLRPHIAVVTDINKECVAGYSSFEDYYEVFHKFVEQIERDGKFIYKASDEELQKLASGVREDVTAIPYESHAFREEQQNITLITRFGEYIVKSQELCFPVNLFLEHINGIRLLCRQLGIQDRDFYASIAEPAFDPEADRKEIP